MAINTQALQSALSSLGDTGGAEAAANLGSKGDRAGLNSLVEAKVAALEKSIAAVETFIDGFDEYDNYLDESWKDEPKDPAQQEEQTPKEDTRTPEERSAAATKAAETREANGNDQWRAPAGTPLGGQFIDMPHTALEKVGLADQGATIKSLLSEGSIDEARKVAEQNLQAMNNALSTLYSMSFSVNVESITASGGSVTTNKNKWEGPLGFEGQFTGDNRYILPMALEFSNVTFPQPFRWASEDIGAHDGARVIGTIEGINRLEDGTIWGWGTFDVDSELGKDAQRHVEKHLSNGVSLDLDRISAEVSDHASLRGKIGNLAEAVQDMNITTIKSARTRSATLVALPAFEGARIEAVEKWSQEEQEEMSETPIPQDEEKTKDSALALERIREGLAKFATALKAAGVTAEAHTGELSTEEATEALAETVPGFTAEDRDARLTDAGYDVAAVSASGTWVFTDAGAWELVKDDVILLTVSEEGGISVTGNGPVAGLPEEKLEAEQVEELAKDETTAVAPEVDHDDDDIEEDLTVTAAEIPAEVVATLPEGTQVYQPGDVNPWFEGEVVEVPFVVLPELDQEWNTVAYLDGSWFPVLESPGDEEESYDTIEAYIAAVAAAQSELLPEGEEPRPEEDDDDFFANNAANAAAARENLFKDLEDPSRLDYAVRNEMDREERASLVASGAPLAAPIAPPAAWFENPEFKMGTPLTVTKEGRVFGHLALWGTCHAAYANASGDCISVPYSETNYSMFHLGVVETAEGTEVPVGRLAMETGHADDNFSSRRAIAHYENTGLAIADVRAGEDEFGIWFSGALRPDATPAQIRALKASPLSGDWRYHPEANNLELVMALAVNMPGFAVPRPQFLVASGAVRSLVAAGILAPKKVAREKVEAAVAGDQLAIDDIKYLQKLAARERANEAKLLKQRALVASGAPNKIHALAAQLKGDAKSVEGKK